MTFLKRGDQRLASQPLDTSYPTHTGGYHERQGYQTASPTDSSRPSKLYLPNSRWTWAFLIINTSQAAIGIALECYIFAAFEQNIFSKEVRNSSSVRTIGSYLSLFIFGFIYQLVLVWDALRLKNTIQVIGLVLYNVGLLVEAGVQYDQINDAVGRLTADPEAVGQFSSNIKEILRPYIIAVPCVLAVGTLLMAFVAWKLYDEFAWSIYKQISADTRLRRMFLSYQVYIALLKFDFFFFLAFTVQFLVVVPQNVYPYEEGITIAAMPVTIVLLILAAVWTRLENIYGACGTLLLYFAGLAYFCFKLVRMYAGPSERKTQYLPARKSLTTFAVITIILLVVTIIFACICASNFNRGLKPHVNTGSRHWGRRRARSEELTGLYPNDSSAPLASPGPVRMTID